MTQTRTSISVACAQATKTLMETGKEIFSVKDIRIALLKANRGGASTMPHYMGSNGHLVERGFLEHVIGGYELTDASKKSSMIVVKITPGNEFVLGELFAAIGRTCAQFPGITEIQMEV